MIISFAKIPIILNSDNLNPRINLDCLLAPGANGRNVEKGEIMILDSDSPELWALEINPKQQEVGNYFLTLKDNSIKKQIGLIVRNVNDAPIAIDPINLPEDALNITILQNQNLEKDISHLFKDEDKNKLFLEKISGPSWIKLDQSNNKLYGKPENKDVGDDLVIIAAKDIHGAAARQQIDIKVLNVNDIPTVGKIISPINAIQGENLFIKLPIGTFNDADFEVDPNEILKYSLHPFKDGEEVPKWLNINNLTGNIDGIPLNENVGKNQFKIRATDNSGTFAETAVSIIVENTNDKPTVTAQLDEFLSRQKPLIEGGIASNIEDELALFSGIKRSINISELFTDPDFPYDENEKITYKLKLENDFGEKTDLSSEDALAKFDWISWKEELTTLELLPTSSEIGIHYLHVEAVDRHGETLNNVVPLYIRHINSSPKINFNIDDLEQIKSKSQGISSIQARKIDGNLVNQELTYLTIEIEEESEISIQFPIDFFDDIDLEIDPGEILDIDFVLLDNDNPEINNDELRFNSESMSIEGSTKDLGVLTKDGLLMNGKFTATDKAGLTVGIDIQFILKSHKKFRSIN